MSGHLPHGLTPAPPSPPEVARLVSTGSPSGGLRGHWGYPGRVPGAVHHLGANPQTHMKVELIGR